MAAPAKGAGSLGGCGTAEAAPRATPVSKPATLFANSITADEEMKTLVHDLLAICGQVADRSPVGHAGIILAVFDNPGGTWRRHDGTALAGA